MTYSSYSYGQDGQDRQDHCIVKKLLENGEAIVNCGGVDFRTITTDHAREIEKRKIELDAAKETIRLLEKKLALEAENVASQERIVKLQQENLALQTQQINIYRSLLDDLQIRFENLAKVVKDGQSKGFFKAVWMDILKLGIAIGTLIAATK